MKDLLYKLLPMLLSMALAQIIYFKVDERYGITDKINSKLPVKEEWKRFFYFCSLIAVMFIIGVIDGVISKYVMDISPTVFFTVGGALTGICIGIINKMRVKKI